VVIGHETDDAASKLQAAAIAPFAFNKSVLRLTANQASLENLPPAMASTVPHLPQLKAGKSFAVLCSGSTCQPPISDVAELRMQMENALRLPS
jgi:hypothetical protein